MAVTKLCICSGRTLVLAVAGGAERVVLVRDVLRKIWCDHLLHFFRLVVIVVNLVVVIVIVVVSMHQGGVSGRNLGAP